MIALVMVFFVHTIDALQVSSCSRSAQRLSMAALDGSSMTATALDTSLNEFDDPYGDLLNMNRAVETEQLMTTWSIDPQKEAGLPLVQTRMNPNRPKKQWEHWDAFMEREFGDMDAELGEDQKWMQEARDVVELKRGFAIWSKRSDKDLQREMRKSLEKKSVKVPENVAMIIRAVFLEKTHTMRYMKTSREHEMACIDFRKWMIGQKKKSKKDPLPQAKVEVSKKWLLRPPNASLGYSRSATKPPPLVMDEQTGSTYPVNIPPGGSAFGWAASTTSTVGGTVGSGGTGSGGGTGGGSGSGSGGGKSNGPTAVGGSVSGVVGSTSTSSAKTGGVVTTSMVHWNTGRDELPASMTGAQYEDDRPVTGAAGRVSDGRRGVFYVDSEELFVPSSLAALARRGGAGSVGGEGRSSGLSSGQSSSQPTGQQQSTGRGRQSAAAGVDVPSVVPSAVQPPAETDPAPSEAPDAAHAADDFYVVL
jgi:hypothetical protein